MRKHILLIDDDEDELQIFMAALNDAGIPAKCTYAKSAEQAFRILDYLTPDLIFLDYNMPKINGLRCLKEIKQMNKVQDVPVILYSNFISNEMNQKAAELGVHVCIHKPVQFDTFTAILRDIIEEPPSQT